MAEISGGDPHYLTTREVAELLRVKERKIYDLVAESQIPHRRVIGKLLFPRAEIIAWIDGTAVGPSAVAAERPAVAVGSHDPLLDWAIRESGCSLATLFDGSSDGLDRFSAGAAAVAALHLPEPEGVWNIGTVSARGVRDCVLIAFARRTQGLILPADTRGVGGLADLRGKRVILRQPGAGGRALFDRMLSASGLGAHDFDLLPDPARTETEAAAAVAAGEADAALGLAGAARSFRLGFLPLVDECFDLLIDRRAYFGPKVQTLLRFTRSDAFRAKAATLAGYDLAMAGEVRWVSS